MNTQLDPDRKSEITLANITDSDCGVIALQAVARLRRVDAVNLARTVGGWKDGHGMTNYNIHRCLTSLGHRIVPEQHSPGATVATFAVTHEYGRFLIYTDGHVGTLIEGDLRNMSKAEWHCPIESVIRVELAD